jgi:hypothetical protein
MKNLVYLVGFLVFLYVLAVPFDLDTALLGQDIINQTTIPIGTPDVDPNSAADSAREGANKGADEVANWSPQTLQMIVIGLLALGITVAIYRSPKLRYMLIGGGAALILLIAFVL